MMSSPKNIIGRFSSWYFNKQVLPYWVILILDGVIVLVSCVFTYWVTYSSQTTYENHVAVFSTALFYAVLGWLGATLFRTYKGVLRYSSFVDLLKLTYANAISLILAVTSSLLFKWQGVDMLSAMTPLNTVMAFLVATMLMWGMRILVKLIFDETNANNQAIPVLIYGALSGGVGIAKNIRSQRPIQFELSGFISRDHRIKDMKLLGAKVYTLDDDLKSVIEKERIQAVLVSPLKANEFRNNQDIQDVFINAGCKIFMAHDAREAQVKNGTLTDEDIEGMQLKEVSVEDLLPRSEIRVDMKSVGDMLTGKRVLITGAAGSIGMEMVKQVARFKPAAMMLIDQAETPQHDVDCL